MFRFTNLMFILVILISFSCQQEAKVEESTLELTTREDSINYSIGHDVGSNLGSQEYEWNADLLSMGIQDALSGDTLLSEEEMVAVLNIWRSEMQAKSQQKFQEESMLNQQKEQEFLSTNESKEGVMVSESGLQYTIIQDGKGIMPDSNDLVSFHFVASTIDDGVFQNTLDQGTPLETVVNQVSIEGWQEGLKMMKEGAIYEFYVPSRLAFGQRGLSPQSNVGPNEMIITKIELLSVKKR